ncbi:STAS domain-containing protein [Nocardia sp. CDC160]|uniref:STAS domain-containing protein n=1 Tax=Nocardia sp. CDC160 TaxID=3112166 RepID=UPI002DB92FB5|nr:STAS domain-containing protein [Nocardia sp. CDC160]MEC3913128.1 STAS domain-containing protein [Nocardia sp. CDC160]
MDQRDLRVLGCIESPLRVSWDVLGDDVVVRVAGEIDLSTAGVFETALRKGIEAAEPGTRLIVDLNEVEFLGVAGLHKLRRAREECIGSEVVLMVVASGDEVVQPVRVLGMESLLELRAQFPPDCALIGSDG